MASPSGSPQPEAYVILYIRSYIIRYQRLDARIYSPSSSDTFPMKRMAPVLLSDMV